jgi:dTDP-4-dehydrorhamnose reductase
MTRVLILGGSGMLGHELYQHCATRFDVYATFRTPPAAPIFDPARCVIADIDAIPRAIIDLRPSVVVNCLGIVKQDPAASDPQRAVAVNAEFPHRLAGLGARLIHLSTDCVFSGARGHYRESDAPDPCDLYGRTKLAGEVTGPNCLTIRTSMIGRELRGTNGLVEWFLSRAGTRVNGWTRAIFSGFTTAVMARIIGDIIETHPALTGLYHVASAPISKFDLLSMLNDAFECGTEIVPNDSVVCDRSLDALRFNAATGFQPPSWQEMISEMARC